MSHEMPAGVEILAPLGEGFSSILTPDAMEFVATLHRAFEGRRQALLGARVERQQRIDGGELPGFLPETAEVRAGTWRIGALPPALVCRRVEITGPV